MPNGFYYNVWLTVTREQLYYHAPATGLCSSHCNKKFIPRLPSTACGHELVQGEHCYPVEADEAIFQETTLRELESVGNIVKSTREPCPPTPPPPPAPPAPPPHGCSFPKMGDGWPNARGRRCGTCCGAADTSSPMCSGTTGDGQLRVSEAEVQHRCANDDGFVPATGQYVPPCDGYGWRCVSAA